jgi:hypothetical protein
MPAVAIVPRGMMHCELAIAANCCLGGGSLATTKARAIVHWLLTNTSPGRARTRPYSQLTLAIPDLTQAARRSPSIIQW